MTNQNHSEPFSNFPQNSEARGNVPHISEPSETVQHDSEADGSVPQRSEDGGRIPKSADRVHIDQGDENGREERACEQLMEASRRIGELETKLLQLEATRNSSDANGPAETL